MDAAQDVGRVAHVGHGNLLVDLARVVTCLDLAPDQLVVLAGGDGLGEDRRVAGEPSDPIGHHLLELAARQQITVDEVDPRTLVLFGVQPMQGIRHDRASTSVRARTSVRAASAMQSASMPAPCISSAGVPEPGMSRTASL